MKETPTGKIRLRLHNRPFKPDLLVVQIEVEQQGGGNYDPTDGSISPSWTCTLWRDAKVEDLTPELKAAVVLRDLAGVA